MQHQELHHGNLLFYGPCGSRIKITFTCQHQEYREKEKEMETTNKQI